MRIVLLSAANNIHTVRWANALSENNDVYVISCKDHIEGKNKFYDDVKIVYLKYNSGLGYYFNRAELKKHLKKINPDIVNVHYASGYGTLARIANVKNYLLNVWGSDVYDFPKESRFKKSILIKNFKHAAYIASTSNCMANEIKKYTNKHIYITPFGVDTQKFYPLRTHAVSEKPVIFGTVKALDDTYGIEYLIKAAHVLKEKLQYNFKYYIYGTGPKKNEYQELIQNFKLNECVFLKGYVENDKLNSVIDEFDISLFGSISESFGVAAIESMACGVPVIASDADGFKEVIVNEITGLIYERKNVDQLVTNIIKLIESPELYKSISENSVNRVRNIYSWNKSVSIMLDVYGDVLKNNK